GVVYRQRRTAYSRLRKNHAGGVVKVIGRAAIGLIPAVSEFASKTDAQLERRLQFDGIFRIESALGRTPAQRGIGWRIRVGAYDPLLNECLQAAEGDLTVLILHKAVVRLQALKPDAQIEKMIAMCERQVVFGGKQIAHRTEIASGVRAAIGDLRGTIQCGATTHDHSADGLAGINPGRQINCGSTIEIEA